MSSRTALAGFKTEGGHGPNDVVSTQGAETLACPCAEMPDQTSHVHSSSKVRRIAVSTSAPECEVRGDQRAH